MRFEYVFAASCNRCKIEVQARLWECDCKAKGGHLVESSAVGAQHAEVQRETDTVGAKDDVAEIEKDSSSLRPPRRSREPLPDEMPSRKEERKRDRIGCGKERERNSRRRVLCLCASSVCLSVCTLSRARSVLSSNASSCREGVCERVWEAWRRKVLRKPSGNSSSLLGWLSWCVGGW